ncbi:MAG TPA: class I SAM-dependent methyltransferase [Burkholderiales bacterium]|nr:class I SAM-dependent methyltransferase [Burkholderiales bacterium]
MQRLRLHAALSFALLGLSAALLSGPAHAQAGKAAEYTPQVGQEGKDVIWVPTPQSLVERMLDMAKLTPKDIHYDLGSGDGRTVIAAAKRGATSYGVEYNPDMVALSERAAAKEGVSGKAKFIHGDIFQTDFSQATVLTLYLLPSLNVKLRPTILKMKPGTRVVSHAFSMDDWQADQTENVEGRTAYLWIVPARVEGTWRWSATGNGPHDYELMLRQQYQQVEGVVRLDDKMGQLRNVKLSGDRITFSIIESTSAANSVQRDFTGRVSDNTMEGTVKLSGGETKWSATRVK